MSTTPRAGPLRALFTVCVEAAVAAPSIHNTQPWRFRIGERGIDVLADRDRRLDVLDPSGRELLISVGAAVLNLRVAMLQHGHLPVQRLLPDPAEPDLVARIIAGPPVQADQTVQALAAAIPRRHTNRRPFNGRVLPHSVLDELIAAAAAEGATLTTADATGRDAILSLVRTADERLRTLASYRAELTDWTLPLGGRHDGVPVHAFGPWDALERLPMRDFGLTQPELHRRQAEFEPHPTLVLLATDGDGPGHWVRAGQALQRTLLTATIRGVASTPMTQPLELPELRELLTDTRTGRWAQVILRLGYGPPTVRSPRRPLAEVLLPDPGP